MSSGLILSRVSPPFDPSGGTAFLGVSIMFELICQMAVVIDAGKMGPSRWVISVGASLWLVLGLSGKTVANVVPHKLAYEIEWGHLVLARSQVDLTPDGRRLTIDASVESGGLAGFWPFQTIARAALEADNGRWQSRVLTMRRVSGQARVESRVEWMANGMLLAQSLTPALDLDKVHPLPANMPPAVLGPYAAILNLLDRVAATGLRGW